MLNSSDIVFCDDSLVVINKPAGLLVHPSFMDKFNTETAMKQLRDLLGKWVFPIHRLDRPTSGILLFALNKEIARTLCETFIEHKIKKTYLAVVRGYTEETGVIDYPLKKIWDKMTDMESSKDQPAQEAITEYERLATIELPFAMPPHPTSRYSLVRVTPRTGRLRQIRRHMKHIFHPILGDHKHGDNKHNKHFAEHLNSTRLMLHAHTIAFSHPLNGNTIELKAALPADFSEVLIRAGVNIDFLMTT